MNQINKIQKTFSEQATKFGEASLTLARKEYLNWMIESLPIESNFDVLDVAAGTAHLSRAIAPHVKQVTAFDVTPEMLNTGKLEAAKSGLQNIDFKLGNAEKLPFNDNTFDLVISRFSIHHFTTPSIQVAEMVRVCKPSGFVGLIDMVSSQNENLANQYNHWERVRDPSHTKALSSEEFADLISNSGLTPSFKESREIEVNVDAWLDLTQPKEETIQEIKNAIKQDIASKKTTGLRPFKKDNQYKFFQSWDIVVGKKDN